MKTHSISAFWSCSLLTIFEITRTSGDVGTYVKIVAWVPLIPKSWSCFTVLALWRLAKSKSRMWLLLQMASSTWWRKELLSELTTPKIWGNLYLEDHTAELLKWFCAYHQSFLAHIWPHILWVKPFSTPDSLLNLKILPHLLLNDLVEFSCCEHSHANITAPSLSTKLLFCVCF